MGLLTMPFVYSISLKKRRHMYFSINQAEREQRRVSSSIF